VITDKGMSLLDLSVQSQGHFAAIQGLPASYKPDGAYLLFRLAIRPGDNACSASVG
jgi:hypothetical protein